MCGRFNQNIAYNKVITSFCVDTQNSIKAHDFIDNRDCRPGQELPLIYRYKDNNILRIGRWGLGRSFAGHGIINLRAEKIRTGTFSSLLTSGRCIVPVASWYEWHEKVRYEFTLDGCSVFGLAGVYEVSERAGRFAILTKTAQPELEKWHPRMPVVLKTHEADHWLGEIDDDPFGAVHEINVMEWGG